MNRFLWIAAAAVAVVLWAMASTVMPGMFLFVPLAVCIWGVLTPVQPTEHEAIDDKFWSLVRWNVERS